MSAVDDGPVTVDLATALASETSVTTSGAGCLRVAAATHVGRVRESNEDSLAVGGWSCCGSLGADLAGKMSQDGAFLAVVADGLGGHASGEVASRLAVGYLEHNRARLVDRSAVSAVLREADALIHAEGRRAGAPDAGTTVAGIVVHESRVLAFNVGDSLVLAILDAEARALSRADRVASSGGLSQCLGGGTAGIEPHVLELEREPGDRFLLATDGLTDLLDASTIAGCVGGGDLDGAARHLVDLALAAGGRDNVTVVAVQT